MDDFMESRILAEIDAAEQACWVRSLLAVESGSRAWGMGSKDSDYDVRFVYVRGVRDYLRLEKVRDTIEWRLDEVYDVVGWDLSKFLTLMRNSNPTVFEWLSSPIVYAESPELASVRDLSTGCFSPKACAFHYLGIARSNSHNMRQKDTVGAKRYLYTIRALLAARWCLEEQSPTPMLIGDLIEAKLPAELRCATDELREVRASGKEKAQISHINALDQWIAQEDATLQEAARNAAAPATMAWESFNKVFTDIILAQ